MEEWYREMASAFAETTKPVLSAKHLGRQIYTFISINAAVQKS